MAIPKRFPVISRLQLFFPVSGRKNFPETADGNDRPKRHKYLIKNDITPMRSAEFGPECEFLREFSRITGKIGHCWEPYPVMAGA